MKYRVRRLITIKKERKPMKPTIDASVREFVLYERQNLVCQFEGYLARFEEFYQAWERALDANIEDVITQNGVCETLRVHLLTTTMDFRRHIERLKHEHAQTKEGGKTLA